MNAAARRDRVFRARFADRALRKAEPDGSAAQTGGAHFAAGKKVLPARREKKEKSPVKKVLFSDARRAAGL